ncbi:MAG: transglycosylase domain-containing protein [Bacteroidales bacterium]|nr:transglycosylase domain-containing protein [Bacteroidales bacterium]
MTQKEKKSKGRKLFLSILWGIIVIGILSVAGIFTAITKGWIGYVPPLQELENPKNDMATQIFSSDGKLLGTFFIAKENRVNCTYNEISPDVINALVATEDERFYKHSGIDAKSTLRAFLFLGKRGGGSTLTQQLAKQHYSTPAKNTLQRAIQKPVEWVIAVQLERLYTKEEILTMYLNKFDFINNAVGIKTASKVYFGKEPKDLKTEEAAMLVGMCKNPSLYNPASKKEATRERAKARRNVVLNQMYKNDYITKAERDSLQQLDVVLDFHRVDHKDGIAPYFREYLRRYMQAKKPKRSNYASWQLSERGQFYQDSVAWANDPLYGFLEKHKKKDGSSYNLYYDGLRIYTTINYDMQVAAEEAVREHLTSLQASFFKDKKGNPKAPFSRNVEDDRINSIMQRAMKNSDRYRMMKKNGKSQSEIEKAFNTPTEMTVFSWHGDIDTVMTPMDSIRYLKHFARTGMMSMDPITGHVKAYVGGPDFSFFQYDMATMGRRQVGSTVKPYLYTLAMEEGYCPNSKVVDQKVTLYDALGRPFTPRGNAGTGEVITLQRGLQTSNNNISAYLMSLFTPEQLVELMRSFGIQGPIDPTVSLCLGPCEVTVGEMVSAYTAFPSKGLRRSPIFVTRIEENNGTVIEEFIPKYTEVINEQTSFKMITMMRAVVDGGTGYRIRSRYGITAQACGKTGTTNDNSDGWFIGYVPRLVTGVWVGFEDRDIHFTNMAEGQGASMALPIWGLYMQKVYANPKLGYSENEVFDIPSEYNPNADCE